MTDELDPRYDPRFQRGFSTPAPVSAVAPASERASTFAPAPRVPDRPMPESPVQDAAPQPAAPPAASVPPLLVDRPLTANPAVWALIVVGAALVVAGVVLFTGWTSLARGSGDQPVDYALLQFLIQVTPVLLGLGGATLLGVGFLFAIDRQRRTRMPADEMPAEPDTRWR